MIVPFVIWGFFKLITPLIDPNTRQKLKFNEDLRQHVPPSQLMKAVGGDVEFRYDHASYWPTLNQLADQRREAYRERWVQGGKQIGEFENYLKGENRLEGESISFCACFGIFVIFGRDIIFFLFYWSIAGIFSQRWGDLLLDSFTYTALFRDTCL